MPSFFIMNKTIMRKTTFIHITFSAVIILQYYAYLFLLSANASTNLSTDAEALLAFKSRITSDPLHKITRNWSAAANNLSGKIVIHDLPRLEGLFLSLNQLSGSASPALGKLTHWAHA